MTDHSLPDIGEMIKQISENQTAREMLAGMLSTGNDVPENSGSAPSDGEAVEAGAFPMRHHGGNQSRKALLCALRPYLGTRRAATLDRMRRALDIYDLIEEMLGRKGG